ncbi:molybdopterin binding domain protein [Haladaptatus paucihalophilus DX253]|uniref:Competence/damage-inducible protein cinA n=1 Tax=Haladaptatus paucihalophilus DX253 TaxID=797209 RepID=E7QYK1_HALPU|nr:MULTISPECIES: molybdopterin-binding protein [Haladaptatus]EFW90267.1 molybdopterin binding domain protein [Haladaptatus paucihalophilus DX253]GKZ12214.1 competence damage-inducible protein A [Haladaptatus sp. T7]SHJ99698.1 competence/damage-inducible protein cinA [Haladaptatus paucihalophilus DX253]
MNVALVTVGDEILSGDTVNTNAAWLGERLTERGVAVERVFVVPDRVGDIARVVNEARAEYDAVLVTGGLGPTHDDLTMEGIAAAVGVPVEEHTEAVEWIEAHSDYSHADLTSGTTHLPKGSRMLPNDVGVAPGAEIEDIYVLPGVPSEMHSMFERIADEFDGEPYYTETVPAGEPESALLDRFETLRERFDVKVGSYPGDYVRVKIEGTDENTVQNAAEWLRERVEAPDETNA